MDGLDQWDIWQLRQDYCAALDKITMLVEQNEHLSDTLREISALCDPVGMTARRLANEAVQNWGT